MCSDDQEGSHLPITDMPSQMALQLVMMRLFLSPIFCEEDCQQSKARIQACVTNSLIPLSFFGRRQKELNHLCIVRVLSMPYGITIDAAAISPTSF